MQHVCLFSVGKDSYSFDGTIYIESILVDNNNIPIKNFFTIYDTDWKYSKYDFIF